MKMAKLGLLFDQKEAQKRWSSNQNVFEVFLFEVMDHLRIPYEKIGFEDLSKSYDVVISVLCGERPENGEKLLDYVSSGGMLISYGGLECIKDALCFSSRQIGQIGYAFLSDVLSQKMPPLRYLAADSWSAGDNSWTIVQQGTISSTNKDTEVPSAFALQKITYGNGSIQRWSVRVPETIVGLQQGTKPVTEDGIPAPDGTANLDEGLLKADDGFELDWELDRSVTETGMPYFPHPYADLWKEAIIEHLFSCAAEKGLTVPFLDYWPADIKHMAMISHDSDLNVDESALITLDTLKRENVQSTWCMIAPGYSPYIYENIKSDGHEIAMHYNALDQDDGVWSKEAFSEQLKWVQNIAGSNQIVSNKNHYTLFEGWGELFGWCENHGIQVDQTRGPSKKGNVGFLFGTCHPYFPAAWADKKNRSYNVLEIGFLTQDLNHHALSDSSIIEPFLDGVKKVNGVAHFLFHQYHLYNQPKVREAITQLIRTAKEQGFTFWTSSQINQWERDRRKVSIKGLLGEIEVDSKVKREDFAVLVPLPESTMEESDDEIVNRFGFRCRKVRSLSNIV
ncbi:polysaccharide deacetylase family protein [Falsibacillus albus]|uniref:NodB homology domain-containing protein n=1 Tax=Falsibacillus albus TaxID=2478915 RepID=A0A3L7JXK8_9BACI|nr:hypothetical protein [Falsibacillus albus]RLQ94859.1 hypothetical protein D9X91_12800 [Falsibacillus albus]